MTTPLRITLYFIYFAGLFIPLILIMLIYPVYGNASIFPKLLPFPLFAIAAIVLILLASARASKRKLFLSLAAVASLPLVGALALSIDNFLPGASVIGLFPAVILLEEAHCGDRRRRRALSARRALGGDDDV